MWKASEIKILGTLKWKCISVELEGNGAEVVSLKFAREKGRNGWNKLYQINK